MREQGTGASDACAAGGRLKRWDILLRLIVSAYLSGLLTCAGGALKDRNSTSQKKTSKTVVTLSYRMVPKGVTPEQIRALSIHIKLFHNRLVTTLGTPRHSLIPFSVFVYPNRGSFLKAIQGIRGRREGDFLYEEGTQNLYMAVTPSGLWGLGRFHVRVFLSAACRHLPPWLTEGFVEFYETGLRQPGASFGFPRFDPNKAKTALLALKNGSIATTLTIPSGRDLSSSQRHIAWALIYWLMKVKPKRHPCAKIRAFNRYISRLIKGDTDVDFFKVMGISEEMVKQRIMKWLERRLTGYGRE